MVDTKTHFFVEDWLDIPLKRNNTMSCNGSSSPPPTVVISSESKADTLPQDQDWKIVTYLRKKQIMELREKRQKHEQHMSIYKQLMIQFLRTIFDPSQPIPVEKKKKQHRREEENEQQQQQQQEQEQHVLQPMPFSVFEGMRVRDMPTVHNMQDVIQRNDLHRRRDIFEEGTREHEFMMNSNLSL
jgi:hypothetical protein